MISSINRAVCLIHDLAVKVVRRLLILLTKPRFAGCGINVVLNPLVSFHHGRIQIGSEVFIGSGAVFHASVSGIQIGSKVVFGPQVMIMGGNHNTAQAGRFMYDVKAKLPENDRLVVIEDDFWVGARNTTFKGVTIGTGSVIGAGSVVIRRIPAYSIAAGVPARLVKARFADTDLDRHKSMLGAL